MMNICKVDSCIAFLGNIPGVDWKAVASRLKPGSHVAALCPVLDQHRITQGIEDAGFEIRDCIMFIGNPKLMVTLARVPLETSVAQNVLRYGTGALNIDGCRVGTETRYNTPASPTSASRKSRVVAGYRNDAGTGPGSSGSIVTGRWPANVIVQDDENIKAAFPKTNKQAICRSGDKSGWQTDYVGGKVSKAVSRKLYLDDENGGSASRFFYSVQGDDRVEGLIDYLVRLINPPGGKVLFLGLDSKDEW